MFPFKRAAITWVSMLLLLAVLFACGNKSKSDTPDETSPATNTVLPESTTLRVTVSRASVFALPHRNAEIIYNLVEGDSLEVLGKSRPDELNTVFYLIQIGERPGWVAASQVELNIAADQLVVVQAPTLTTEPPTEVPVTPVYDAIARVTVSTTILDHPSFSGLPLVRVEPGEEYVIVARTPPTEAGAIFYGVRIQTGIGWLPDSEVEIIGEELAAPVVVSETPTTAPTAVTPIQTAIGTAAVVSPTVVYSATPYDGAQAQIVVPEAAVTDFPEAEGTVIYTAIEGEIFGLVGVTPMNAQGIVYYALQLDEGVVGWVRGADVDVIGDTADVPLMLTSTPNASPTVTPFGVEATVTNIPTATPTAMVAIPTESTPTVRFADPPLLTIELPTDWDEDHFLIPISSQFVEGDIILSVYEGPLMEGVKGYIWVVWRFPNVLPYDADSFDLWADAVLYLRSMLFMGCNIGLDTENRTTYTIGGQEAVGSTYSAVQCVSGAEDVAGWFAALQYEGENYVFYMGVEPANMIGSATPALRQIANSITFVSVE